LAYAGPARARVRAAVAAFLSSLCETAPTPAPDAGGSPCEIGPGECVVVACSGGPDSLALAEAAAFAAPRAGLRAGAVIVDHGIQAGSAGVAGRAATQCRGLGLDPVEVVTCAVAPGPNLEARARAARYGALAAAARRAGTRLVLLGHTLDDQAEQVLLALARGSGARAVAAMSRLAPLPEGSGQSFGTQNPVNRDQDFARIESGVGLWAGRPLLGIRRADTLAACADAGLDPWLDPDNEPGAPHPSRRSELRGRALPLLEEILGPGLAPGLARTADAARADADLLDQLADREWRRLTESRPAGIGLPAKPLAAYPAALRHRLLYRAALSWGVPAARLTRRHVLALDRLLTDWHGQGPVALPGGVRVARECGKLVAELFDLG
jgi:tRNA(Ile)-lysidine synthase